MAKRRRILFVLPTLDGGGAENVVCTVLRHLDRGCVEPHLLIATDAGGDRGPTLENRLPADVIPIRLTARKVRSSLPLVLHAIRRIRPDVVVSVLDHMSAALGLTRPFWPRQTRWLARLTSPLSLEVPILAPLLPLSLRLADGVVLQSSALEGEFGQDFARVAAPRFVIPNPLDLPRIAAETGGVAPATPEDGLRLVAVGRLDPVKQYDVLIAALAQLRNPSVRLTIVGDGPEREALRRQVSALGLGDQVDMTGWSDAPLKTVKQAHALVMCSRREGFPNVVIEALACGVAVIATPTAGMANLLNRAPPSRLVGGFDKDALTAALSQAAAAPPGPVDPSCVRDHAAPAVAQAWESAFEAVLSDQPASLPRAA